MKDELQPNRTTSFRIGALLVLLVFLGIAAFLIVTEHTAHLFGAVPYLLVGVCLLLHLFIHGSHGDHDGHSEGGSQ